MSEKDDARYDLALGVGDAIVGIVIIAAATAAMIRLSSLYGEEIDKFLVMVTEKAHRWLAC